MSDEKPTCRRCGAALEGMTCPNCEGSGRDFDGSECWCCHGIRVEWRCPVCDVDEEDELEEDEE